MIEFKNLKKKFGESVVLKDISGEFLNSKVNLIIGSSGGGKSVFLKCLVGLFDFQFGEVKYDGDIFSSKNEVSKNVIRKKIGMLFQGAALFDSMNTEENVMFPLNMFSSFSLKEKKKKVNAVLEKVGLQGVNKKMPNELSGGMKKRAGIARAIVNDPKYLFCDEPNSGLDPKNSLMIDDLIKKITYENNITTVVVTHDINSIFSIGDNIFFLKKGEIKWRGLSEDIEKNSNEDLREFLFSSKLASMLFEKNKYEV